MTGPVGVRLSATRTRSTNDHGQPLGRPVEWTGATAPARDAVLEGRGVRLEPIGPQHVDDLFGAVCREADDPLWTYLLWDRPVTREALAVIVEGMVEAPDAVPFAIVPVETGRAAGLCSFLRIDPRMGSIEVGGILLGRQLQRSRAATEAMALLMRHAFDDLGFRRYEWKCDSLNGPSRRAAVRLGFIWEGRFRNALVYKGRNRDTDWFSITDREWPRVGAALDAWLDDDNFDDLGRQRTRLAARPQEQQPDQQPDQQKEQ